MKKRKQNRIFSIITTTILTAALFVSTPLVTMAGQPNTGINGGQFTDWNTLTWTANDGTETTYGRGPVFADIHPEITDPEYYLKEYYLYLGEVIGTVNSAGMTKQTDPTNALGVLKTFLNSFDWIHSDELTRAEKVFNRIANGHNGNIYDTTGVSGYEGGYRVLREGKGICQNFSDEFCGLANFVGLECETYYPSDAHQACLLKLNGQWFAVDPTSGTPFLSNATTYPVDYETEKNRYALESASEREKYNAENPDSLVTIIDLTNQKTAAGLISEADWASINPMEAELDRKLSAKEISYGEYEKQMGELLKSMW
ncbi:hypothetical protein [[Clostridium] symbiosum]|uniref:hypothetical protein n=1 Tax=Clostridium symbiosum TaxID=1512 RepID=UPI0034A16DED